MDLRRFGAQYRSRRLTLARTHEVYRTYYDLRYPNQEREEGRRLRLSPAYPRLRELGAAFGEKSGWERPNWFEPNAGAGDEGRRPRGFAGRIWSPAIEAEHLATRERAGLFDETSFSKLEVVGVRRARPPPAPLRQRRRPAGRVGRLHLDAERARRDRVRLHRHAARPEPLPHRHRHGVRHPRPRVHPAAPAGRRVGHAPRRDRRLLLHRPLGAPRARRPRGHDHDRRVERRLPVPDGAGSGGRARPGAGGARDVRGGAGLGDLRADGVWPRAVGHAVGGRAARMGWSRPAIAPSTPSGSRRATATGAPTSRPTTRRTRPGSGSRSSSGRATSSARRR